MIQPINSVPHTSFKNSAAPAVEPVKQNNAANVSSQSDIISYLEAKDKKDKQNALIMGGLSIALTVGILAYMPRMLKNVKKNPGVVEKSLDFVSLKNDKEIPTLNTCNSIDKKLKEFLQNQVDYAKATPDAIQKTGVPRPANKLLLYGAPGSGKSFFAKIFSKTLDAEYKEIKYSDLNSRWVGEHLENISKEFESIINTSKKNPDKKFVVTFNEIDSLLQPVNKLQQGYSYSTFKQDERAIVLTYLDEISTKAPNVTIIGTTNLSPKNNRLDGAAMSRFKNLIEVSYPDKECLFEALKSHLLGLGEGKEFVEANKDKLNGFVQTMTDRKCSYRDLNSIVDSSKNYYLRDYMKDKNAKFKMEYLERAQKSIDATDGEIAGACVKPAVNS